MPAHGWVGARATSFLAAHFALRNTASNSAEKKQSERGRGGRRGLGGGGIPPRPSRSEAFPPFGIKPNIKAKQLSIPFKRKRVARKIKELKRKLFCFARRSSAGGNAGAGFQIIRAIFARKRFELRSAIATKLNFFQIQRRLVVRSPRRSLSRTAMRERGYARKKPCPPALFQLRRVNISELNRKVGQIQIQFFGKASGGSACEARYPANAGFPIFSIPPKAEYKASFLIPRFCAYGAMAKGDFINFKEQTL